mgnify:CR=1 FL=1
MKNRLVLKILLCGVLSWIPFAASAGCIYEKYEEDMSNCSQYQPSLCHAGTKNSAKCEAKMQRNFDTCINNANKRLRNCALLRDALQCKGTSDINNLSCEWRGSIIPEIFLNKIEKEVRKGQYKYEKQEYKDMQGAKQQLKQEKLQQQMQQQIRQGIFNCIAGGDAE